MLGRNKPRHTWTRNTCSNEKRHRTSAPREARVRRVAAPSRQPRLRPRRSRVPGERSDQTSPVVGGSRRGREKRDGGSPHGSLTRSGAAAPGVREGTPRGGGEAFRCLGAGRGLRLRVSNAAGSRRPAPCAPGPLPMPRGSRLGRRRGPSSPPLNASLSLSPFSSPAN